MENARKVGYRTDGPYEDSKRQRKNDQHSQYVFVPVCYPHILTVERIHNFYSPVVLRSNYIEGDRDVEIIGGEDLTEALNYRPLYFLSAKDLELVY